METSRATNRSYESVVSPSKVTPEKEIGERKRPASQGASKPLQGYRAATEGVMVRSAAKAVTMGHFAAIVSCTVAPPALPMSKWFSCMSRKANPYDNAIMESFFATLKTECFQNQIPKSRREAKLILFDYIEGFYNRSRLHSALQYQSPLEFENNFTGTNN